MLPGVTDIEDEESGQHSCPGSMARWEGKLVNRGN